ncbi:cell division protein CrgA [Flexivirga sp. B27]
MSDNNADNRRAVSAGDEDAAAKKAANKAAAKEEKAARRKEEERERQEKRERQAIDSPSPSWWVPTLCTFMVVGLFWLVVYYLTGEKYPIPNIKIGNMIIGFVLILIGFGMTTRWR